MEQIKITDSGNFLDDHVVSSLLEQVKAVELNGNDYLSAVQRLYENTQTVDELESYLTDLYELQDDDEQLPYLFFSADFMRGFTAALMISHRQIGEKYDKFLHEHIGTIFEDLVTSGSLYQSAQNIFELSRAKVDGITDTPVATVHQRLRQSVVGDHADPSLFDAGFGFERMVHEAYVTKSNDEFTQLFADIDGEFATYPSIADVTKKLFAEYDRPYAQYGIGEVPDNFKLLREEYRIYEITRVMYDVSAEISATNPLDEPSLSQHQIAISYSDGALAGCMFAHHMLGDTFSDQLLQHITTTNKRIEILGQSPQAVTSIGSKDIRCDDGSAAIKLIDAAGVRNAMDCIAIDQNYPHFTSSINYFKAAFATVLALVDKTIEAHK